MKPFLKMLYYLSFFLILRKPTSKIARWKYKTYHGHGWIHVFTIDYIYAQKKTFSENLPISLNEKNMTLLKNLYCIFN